MDPHDLGSVLQRGVVSFAPGGTITLRGPLTSALGVTEGPSLAELDGQLLDGLYFCSRVYSLFETGPQRRCRASYPLKRES